MEQHELKLKEEQVQLIRSFISRGKVEINKEITTEYITVTLPVEVEDLIIEKEVDGTQETLKIPISKESYEYVKRKDMINDIEIYKNYLKDIEHIEVDLNKEELIVKENFY